MTTNAMIDIETLDTSPSSVVLSVGGVKFNPFSTEEPWDKVHWRLDIETQLGMGRTTSESTLEWWSKQDQAIQDDAFSEDNRVDLHEFIKDLNKWVTGADEIWCQGPQFDMVILEDLFKQLDHHKNWQFWQIRDSRTLFKMLPEDPRKDVQEDAHNAMADAYWQAKCVQQAYKHFGVQKR